MKKKGKKEKKGVRLFVLLPDTADRFKKKSKIKKSHPSANRVL